jgi:hypothetical protein
MIKALTLAMEMKGSFFSYDVPSMFKWPTCLEEMLTHDFNHV